MSDSRTVKQQMYLGLAEDGLVLVRLDNLEQGRERPAVLEGEPTSLLGH